MSFKFSKKSLEKLNHTKLHPDLRQLMLEAIKNSPIDFSVIETVRTVEQQKINVAKGAGGIIGQIKTKTPSVVGCIAWNSITTNRAANQYSPGAIVANIQIDGKYARCYRKANMSFSDIAMKLVDHEDIENGRPALPEYEGVTADANQYAYHGKAAAADATVSSVAKTLGWDETVWDLTGNLPVLKKVESGSN